MGEFANMIREQAEAVMRTQFQRECPSEPVMELVTCLLEDGAGGVAPPPSVPVTTEQWITWNRLVTEHQRAVARMVTKELEQERVPLPEEIETMRTWAAQLLLNTLDRMGML